MSLPPEFNPRDPESIEAWLKKGRAHKSVAMIFVEKVLLPGIDKEEINCVDDVEFVFEQFLERNRDKPGVEGLDLWPVYGVVWPMQLLNHYLADKDPVSLPINAVEVEIAYHYLSEITGLSIDNVLDMFDE